METGNSVCYSLPLFNNFKPQEKQNENQTKQQKKANKNPTNKKTPKKQTRNIPTQTPGLIFTGHLQGMQGDNFN